MEIFADVGNKKYRFEQIVSILMEFSYQFN